VSNSACTVTHTCAAARRGRSQESERPHQSAAQHIVVGTKSRTTGAAGTPRQRPGKQAHHKPLPPPPRVPSAGCMLCMLRHAMPRRWYHARGGVAGRGFIAYMYFCFFSAGFRICRQQGGAQAKPSQARQAGASRKSSEKGRRVHPGRRSGDTASPAAQSSHAPVPLAWKPQGIAPQNSLSTFNPPEQPLHLRPIKVRPVHAPGRSTSACRPRSS
jgi:hypothetical protein